MKENVDAGKIYSEKPTDPNKYVERAEDVPDARVAGATHADAKGLSCGTLLSR